MRNTFSLLLLLLVLAPQLLAQDSEIPANSRLTLDEETIADLKEDDAFDYRLGSTKEVTFFKRIWSWLSSTLGKLLGWGGSTFFGKFVFYAVCLAAIIYTLLKMTNTAPRKLLKGSEGTVPYRVHEEDIHQISFDQQIRDALDGKNFKLAVRLTYLQTLKHLSDKGVINWAPSKSNHEYLYEITKEEQRASFLSLSTLFEYCWYGGFDVSKSAFEESRELQEKVKT